MSNQKSKNVIKNAIIMMSGTFTSRILGLMREIITAAMFGASRFLDAFYVAYALANLARQLLAEGALSAAFVPVFSKTLQQSGKQKANQLANQTLSVLLTFSTIVALTGILCSPLLVHIIAPGFDPEKQLLATRLTQLLFPYLIIVSVSALFMGILNSLNSFLIPSIAPALSNITYILIILLLSTRLGVYGLVIAVLCGGLVHMLFQQYWTHKTGMPVHPQTPDLKNPDLKKMLVLFLPYAAGLSLNQLNPMLGRIFASYLEDGAISVLNYANRIIQLPLGLVVIAISQAILPELSKCATQDNPEFRQVFKDAIRFSLFLITPITLGIMLVSYPMVHVLFFRGAFDLWACQNTSTALFWYALGLPGMGIATVTMRALYAKELPKEAMISTIASVIATFIFSFILALTIGLAGVALASSIAFTLSSIIGFYLLQKHERKKFKILNPKWLTKITISLLIMTAAVTLFKHLCPYPQLSPTTLRITWILTVTAIGALSYSLASILLKCEEWTYIKSALKRPKKTHKNKETKQ